MVGADTLQSHEYSAALNSNGHGVLVYSERQDYSNARLRPYTSYGAGVIIVPADQLITLLILSHYQLRGAAGVERTVSGNDSVRAEIAGGFGTGGLQIGATVGYVSPW
jgi:hypothetical protein